MTAKKVLLFIVEGQSDAAALEGVLSRLLSNERVRFHVVGADVSTTPRRGINSVKTEVSNIVKRFIMSHRLEPKDLLQVVHLMDTDGAFVPETVIIEDKNACGFEYTENTIAAQSRGDVIKRNALKAQNMLLLAHLTKTYRGIPYEAYYCSRNLEHVLHNISEKRSAREKLQLSDQFHEQYENAPDEFLSFISSVPPAVPFSRYEASWAYISQQGQLHSLLRGCNLHILLHKLLQHTLSS